MEIFNEMEERFVETNGIKLHTVIIGSGEPLMLLHGFLMTIWNYICKASM